MSKLNEVSRSNEGDERQSNISNTDLTPHRADVQQLLVQQEWSSSVKQEDLKTPHIKEEEEEFWSQQEGEQLQGLQGANLIKFSSTAVPVESENDEEGAQYSWLHQSQTEENRDTEPPASSSTEQMKTESDEEDWGGAEPARNLDPATEDKDSESSEPETDDSNDWKVTREPQSGLKSLKNNQVPLNDIECDNDKKSFICSECGKRFTRKANLTVHMRIHSGEKPFRCSVCGKRFNLKGNLKVHMTYHSGEKPFSCPFCKKHFRVRNQIATHMRIHTGEKPFSCSVCGKKFNQRGHLTIHMRVHSGEKPFNCSVCGKRFIHKGNLKVHMSIYSGSNVCGKNVNTSSTLQDPHGTLHRRETI